jgi:hypothetical protein
MITRIKDPVIVEALRELAKSKLKDAKKRNGVADKVFSITEVSVIFFHYIHIVNENDGCSGKDWGFGFSLPDGLTIQDNLTATYEQFNEDLKKPHKLQLVGGGEGVEGGYSMAMNSNGDVIGVGEWVGAGLSIGATAMVIEPDW